MAGEIEPQSFITPGSERFAWLTTAELARMQPLISPTNSLDYGIPSEAEQQEGMKEFFLFWEWSSELVDRSTFHATVGARFGDPESPVSLFLHHTSNEDWRNPKSRYLVIAECHDGIYTVGNGVHKYQRDNNRDVFVSEQEWQGSDVIVPMLDIIEQFPVPSPSVTTQAVDATISALEAIKDSRVVQKLAA